jgi:hypothetical protein
MSLTEDDKQWITTQLEAVEMRLLRAFHDWASPAVMRVRSHTAVLRALRSNCWRRGVEDRAPAVKNPFWREYLAAWQSAARVCE